MTVTVVSEEELGTQLRSFSLSAFRLEAQPSYAVTEEREAFERFTRGDPQPPSEYGWWQEWLDLVAWHTAHGRTMKRVRVVSEPPTTYQRWLAWGDRWNAQAGERISCISRSGALAAGLPLDTDWWLFDGETVAVMGFSDTGNLTRTTLITKSGTVASYRMWRHVALASATGTAAA